VCDGDWIQLAQERFGWRVIASRGFNLLIPRQSGDSLATAATFKFSKTEVEAHKPKLRTCETRTMIVRTARDLRRN
jgi:hypothetical protein